MYDSDFNKKEFAFVVVINTIILYALYCMF